MIEPYKKTEVFVEYSVALPAPYPSKKRYLLPNQDYGAFKSIHLEDPKIEVVDIEVLNGIGMIYDFC